MEPTKNTKVKYFKLVWFGFNGISTIVGYSMPNPFLDIL